MGREYALVGGHVSDADTTAGMAASIARAAPRPGSGRDSGTVSNAWCMPYGIIDYGERS